MVNCNKIICKCNPLRAPIKDVKCPMVFFFYIQTQIQWSWNVVSNIKTEYNDFKIIFNLYLIEYTTEARYFMFKQMNFIVFGK